MHCLTLYGYSQELHLARSLGGKDMDMIDKEVVIRDIDQLLESIYSVHKTLQKEYTRFMSIKKEVESEDENIK